MVDADLHRLTAPAPGNAVAPERAFRAVPGSGVEPPEHVLERPPGAQYPAPRALHDVVPLVVARRVLLAGGLQAAAAGAGRHARVGIRRADFLALAAQPDAGFGPGLSAFPASPFSAATAPAWRSARLSQPASARTGVASTCTAPPFAIPASTQAEAARSKIRRNRASPRRCRIRAGLEWSGSPSCSPQPMNQRIARSACASRIRRRSCKISSRNPAGISRTAVSGSIPGRPLWAQWQPATSSCSQRDPEPGRRAPGRGRPEPAAQATRQRTTPAGAAACARHVVALPVPPTTSCSRNHGTRGFQQPHDAKLLCQLCTDSCNHEFCRKTRPKLSIGSNTYGPSTGRPRAIGSLAPTVRRPKFFYFGDAS